MTANGSEDCFDMIVVGGGPNGLFCAQQISTRLPNQKVLVIEKGKIVNNIASYPDVRWHSTMGELKLPSYLNSAIDNSYHPTSSELVKYYRHFSKEHPLEILEDHEVTDVRQNKNKVGYNLVVNTTHSRPAISRVFSCSTLILCTGIYENPTLLDRSVSKPPPSSLPFVSYGMDTTLNKKNLVLVGAGNSAVDYIIHLLPKNKITWVIRGESWKSVHHNLVEIFDNVMTQHRDNLTLHTQATVQEIFSDHSISLSNGTLIRDVDHCNVLIGYHSRCELFEKIGLTYEKDCLKLNAANETNLAGIYAFGSVMARWNSELNVPNPTFIHNGNPAQLNLIIDDIIRKKVAQMMTFPSAELKPKWGRRARIKRALKERFGKRDKNAL